MISLCVAARNEAQRIPRLLRSVQGLVSECCLLDNGSTDGTAAIVADWCRGAGVAFRVQRVEEAKGYPDHLYNQLLDMPSQRWTLLLDADEELTAFGREKIHALTEMNTRAFKIPRLTLITCEGMYSVSFWETHYRFFRTGTVRYPKGDLGPHQVAQPTGTYWEMQETQPFILHVRDGREQLRRDKERGQYPDTPLPPYWETVPGWFDYQAIFDLMVEEARPGGHIVEVGCWLGRSTCYLGQKAKEANKGLTVWAVDHFRGSDEQPHKEFFAQGRNLYAECLRNIDGAGLLDTVRVIPAESRYAAYMFDELDGVFLDAAHDYESVKADLHFWVSNLRTGGILAGHDYSSAWPGVCRAVDEMFGEVEIDKRTSPGSWLVRL